MTPNCRPVMNHVLCYINVFMKWACATWLALWHDLMTSPYGSYWQSLLKGQMLGFQLRPWNLIPPQANDALWLNIPVKYFRPVHWILLLLKLHFIFWKVNAYIMNDSSTRMKEEMTTYVSSQLKVLFDLHEENLNGPVGCKVLFLFLITQVEVLQK